MITRLGVSYCRMEGTIMGDEEPTIAQLMKSLIDNRKLREQELAEERSKCEQELKEYCHRYDLAQRQAANGAASGISGRYQNLWRHPNCNT